MPIGTVAARQLAVGGKVYAYEPEPENFEMLKKNIKELNPKFSPDKYELHCKGVDVESGLRTLFLCKHDPSRKYNSKYRHSVVIDHGSGKSVQIECVGIEDLLLRVHSDVNAIKMDIEGPEVPIMEVLTPAMCVNVNKMVVEVTFDAHNDMPRFRKIVERLEGIFDKVHYTGVNERTILPPKSIIMFCIKMSSVPAPTNVPMDVVVQVVPVVFV